LKGQRLGFATPFYTPIPLLKDGGLISRKEFAENMAYVLKV